MSTYSCKNLNIKFVAIFIFITGMYFSLPIFSHEYFPVTIAPYFGIDSQSIVNIPGYNQDVIILKQNALLQKAYEKKHHKNLFELPALQLSGKIEGLGTIDNQSQGLDLSAAEIDFGMTFNSWCTGFMDFAYMPESDENSFSSKNRISLDRAFLTAGNFNVSPFYATFGKRWAPFGQYFTYMIHGPLTQAIGGIKYPSFLLGYQHPNNEGIYTNIYALQGDSGTFQRTKLNYGATLGYDVKLHDINIDSGIDYIRNIADGQGFQVTNNNNFKGFSLSSDFEKLNKLPPGVDLHLKLNVKKITVLEEYITALSPFNSNNLSFNNGGAKLWANHTEMGYNFEVADYPSSFAVGYDRTGQALALNLPRYRYLAAFNIFPLKNMVCSVEFQHGKNYSLQDRATGQTSLPIYGDNKTINGMTFRISAFF